MRNGDCIQCQLAPFLSFAQVNQSYPMSAPFTMQSNPMQFIDKLLSGEIITEFCRGWNEVEDNWTWTGFKPSVDGYNHKSRKLAVVWMSIINRSINISTSTSTLTSTTVMTLNLMRTVTELQNDTKYRNKTTQVTWICRFLICVFRQFWIFFLLAKN